MNAVASAANCMNKSLSASESPFISDRGTTLEKSMHSFNAAVPPAIASKLLDHSPLGFADERQQPLHFGAPGNLRASPRHRQRSIQAGTRQQAERGLQFLDGGPFE